MANPHLSTHMATEHGNNHTAIHGDLLPKIQQAQRSTHTWTTTRCRTPRENGFDVETIAAAPAMRTRYVHHRHKPLHKEKRTVSCSGFLPDKPHATFMQPWQCVLQHQQPQIPKHFITTHTRTTTRCRTQRRNRFDDETSAAAPAAHTRYLSSPAEATLHG